MFQDNRDRSEVSPEYEPVDHWLIELSLCRREAGGK
jgi:hypothetical protein